MKKLLYLTVIVLLSSCSMKNQSYDKQIIGKWQIDSVMSYTNGEELMIKPDTNFNLFAGTIDDPWITQFTQYGEAFFFSKSNSNKRVSKFNIVNDTVFYQSIVPSKIVKLSKQNLVLQYEVKIDYFDKTIEYPKKIITTYYSRVKD